MRKYNTDMLMGYNPQIDKIINQGKQPNKIIRLHPLIIFSASFSNVFIFPS